MNSKLAGYTIAGLLLLVLTLVVSLGIGSVHLPAGQIGAMLLQRVPGLAERFPTAWESSAEQIIMKVRLPRILLGMLVGASLATAGAAFQGVLRNPLADPFTLGVASGSSLGAALLIFYGMQYSFAGAWTLPLVAFVTGAVTLWIVLALSREQGKLPTHGLILAGVIMQSFLGAVVSFLTIMSRDTMNDILFWTLGSLSLRGWTYILVLLPYFTAGLIYLWSRSRALNLLALGERQAAYTGLNVDRLKGSVLVVATLLTAAAVSVSGVIGFVGLVIPHMIRLLTGSDYRIIIPLSALGGAVFMVWSDTAARTLLAPSEIPIGVVTAFIGAPFFAYLLYRSRRQRREGQQ
ncbi:iron ABC transporter permease [Paenibacillus sp. F411]|uniref:Putative corrinoid ABC transporter, permease protein n=1 Tax=Paenibacillus algicola TaxID=2565926 RepID=A0A4V1G498_9BACL|nr:iron ABC transporter permease [Paenibacillus algicola]MBO2943447.1 iron ABC transporter permease [Paenibacillus sp. F411]QCT03944.1 putative corrinoid ABC transporter, permease protein [Paenibacillus algicola]